MEVKLILTIAIFLLVSSVHGGKSGKGKHGKKDGDRNNQVKMIPKCMGQPVNISSLMPAIDECLDSKIKEVMEVTANSKGKKGKNKEKKMAKLSKKLRKKCMADCKWSSFGLIPNTTEENGNIYDSTEVDLTEFLEIFPEEAKESLQTGIMACYNSSKMIPLRKGKGKNIAKQMCSRNKRLVKCFRQTMRKTCWSGRAGKETTRQPMSTPSPAVAPSALRGNGTANSTMGNGTMLAPTAANGSSTPASTPSTPPSTTVKPESTTPGKGKSDANENEDTEEDDYEDDDDDDDDDEDDDDDGEDEEPIGNGKTKLSSPTTSVDTSQPVTK